MRKVTARPTGRPVIPRNIDVDPNHVLVRSDGEVRDALNVSYDAFDIGRMREGYVCIACKEDLDTPFPDECPVCHFPMRERQPERFAKEYEGTVWVGPTTTIEEELEVMNFLRERNRREFELRERITIPKPQIIVPRGF